MPRGDLVYKNQLNHGMRKHQGMPPSHNCVFVDSTITEKELEENWDKAFGKKKEIDSPKCTCNYSEEKRNGTLWLVKEKCVLHGRAFKKILTVSDAPKKHSLSHQKKAKQAVIYGNIDPREVTRRS